MYVVVVTDPAAAAKYPPIKTLVRIAPVKHLPAYMVDRCLSIENEACWRKLVGSDKKESLMVPDLHRWDSRG